MLSEGDSCEKRQRSIHVFAVMLSTFASLSAGSAKHPVIYFWFFSGFPAPKESFGPDSSKGTPSVQAGSIRKKASGLRMGIKIILCCFFVRDKITVLIFNVCWQAKFRRCAIWEAMDEAFITPTRFLLPSVCWPCAQERGAGGVCS